MTSRPHYDRPDDLIKLIFVILGLVWLCVVIALGWSIATSGVTASLHSEAIGDGGGDV